jgi:tetrahydromethanopterin S-methyltransferase subunit G
VQEHVANVLADQAEVEKLRARLADAEAAIRELVSGESAEG